ncbi:MAG: SWIM zinc finger family protein, partial [Chloroflexota bacterium]
MSSLPKLTESDIRARSTTQSMSRARGYYEGRVVKNPNWRDDVLTANVKGSRRKPYEVEIHFNNNKIKTTYCTCPYDYGGDCKHILATLLTLAHEPDAIEVHNTFATMLASLDLTQMTTLLTQLVEAHPHLGSEIELMVQKMTAPPKLATKSSAKSSLAKPPKKKSSTKPTKAAKRDAVVDIKQLQQQVTANLRDAFAEDYDSDAYWDGDDDWTEIDLHEPLQPAIDVIERLLADGNRRETLNVLDAVTQSWQKGLSRIEEYALEEVYYQNDEDVTGGLDALWTQALLSADLHGEITTKQRNKYAVTLATYANPIKFGDPFDMAMMAAAHGWDYAPLKAAMNGHITELGAWEDDDVPDFADALAVIRLGILAEAGHHEAYLNLAQAEGEFLLYLQMLVQLGQSDKAVSEAIEYENDPQDILSLA